MLSLHLLAALLEDRDGVVRPVLEKIGVPVERLLGTLISSIQKIPKVQGGTQPGLSASLQKVLERAFKEAETFKDDFVSTEHLLLALSEAKHDPVELALASQGATHAEILKALSAVRGSQRVTDQNPEGKFQASGEVLERPH